MRHYHYLWLLVIALISTACIKEEPTSGPTKVEGYVKDAVSMKIVPNADVYLTRTRKGDVGAMSTQGIGHTVADNNGKFTFDFNAEDDYSYEICARKQHYNENGICTYINGGRENKNLEVKIQPFTWIKFIILNEPPLDYVDIAVNVNQFFKLYNLHSDTIIYSKMFSGENQITWVIYRNGIESKYTHNFKLTPLDTSEHTIKY